MNPACAHVNVLIFIALFALCARGAFAAPGISLVAPLDGAEVQLLPAAQKAVLARADQAGRRAAAVGEAGPWGKGE